MRSAQNVSMSLENKCFFEKIRIISTFTDYQPPFFTRKQTGKLINSVKEKLYHTMLDLFNDKRTFNCFRDVYYISKILYLP